MEGPIRKLRRIELYWKGPDQATVIERADTLKHATRVFPLPVGGFDRPSIAAPFASTARSNPSPSSFASTTAYGRPCELGVERTRIQAGEGLRALVTAWLQRETRTKRGHEVVRRTEREIAGRPGIDVAVRWRAEPGMVHMREAHVMTAELWLAFMVSGFWEDAAVCDGHIERLIATLKLRGRTDANVWVAGLQEPTITDPPSCSPPAHPGAPSRRRRRSSRP